MTEKRHRGVYPERSRGGQPGNQNSRTHGFYSKAVPPELRHKLTDAAEIHGLDQEIALLRSKIAIAGEQGESYKDLVPGLALLSRLLTTRKKLGYEDNDAKLNNGMAQVWRAILPKGIDDPMQARRILSAYVASGSNLFPSDDDPQTFEKPQTNRIEWPPKSGPAGLTKNELASGKSTVE